MVRADRGTGVRGRVVDLCKPTTRKFEAAISVVLGRNIDAVVVDEEKTAIDCIEVAFPRLPF
jgi:structural maintenance of chromosome 1